MKKHRKGIAIAVPAVVALAARAFAKTVMATSQVGLTERHKAVVATTFPSMPRRGRWIVVPSSGGRTETSGVRGGRA
jgi:hypothetical protein